jgi:heme A synthase
MNTLVFMEWFHRLLVLTATALVIAVVAVGWRRGGRRLRLYGLLCLLLVLATAVLGGLSVLMPVGLVVAAADQGFGMLFFGCLVALTTWAYLPGGAGGPAPTTEARSESPTQRVA